MLSPLPREGSVLGRLLQIFRIQPRQLDHSCSSKYHVASRVSKSKSSSQAFLVNSREFLQTTSAWCLTGCSSLTSVAFTPKGEHLDRLRQNHHSSRKVLRWILCSSMSVLRAPSSSHFPSHSHKNPKALDGLEPLPLWIYLLFFPFSNIHLQSYSCLPCSSWNTSDFLQDFCPLLFPLPEDLPNFFLKIVSLSLHLLSPESWHVLPSFSAFSLWVLPYLSISHQMENSIRKEVWSAFLRLLSLQPWAHTKCLINTVLNEKAKLKEKINPSVLKFLGLSHAFGCFSCLKSHRITECFALMEKVEVFTFPGEKLSFIQVEWLFWLKITNFEVVCNWKSKVLLSKSPWDFSSANQNIGNEV